MRGNLNRTKLPAIIRSFYAERKSGVLHLSCPPGARRIFFRQGRIVRVESDAEPDRAGEQGNALSAEERKGVEIRRMSEIVQPLLASTAGEFRFEESEVPVPKEGAVELPAEQLILDGVRRISDSSVLRALVGDVGATLRTTSSCAFPVFQIKLTPGERGLLESTRKQPSSVGQVLSGSGLGDVETLRALYALLSIGLLEAEGGGEAAPPVEETAPVEAAPEPAPAPASLAPAKEASRAESIPKRFGRYEIQRQLARSSTGILYRGRDPEIDRIVAIKVLHPMVGQPAEVEKLRESFQQEFQKARQLHHPGIVAILEAGMTKEGRPFLITEYVPGTTLRDQLAPGPLAVKHALDLATQIVDALAHAHSRGVVHRRLKPSSVLMTADGRVKIKDFALPGTPEERAGRVADARADVFSFGVLAYRMLTGVLPFPEGSASPSTNPPAPLEKYVRDLPLRFGKIIFRCLAGDPLERFPDAGELKRAWGAPEAPASTATQAVAPVPPPPRPQAPVPAPPKAAEPVRVTRPPAPTRRVSPKQSPQPAAEKAKPAAPRKGPRRAIWAIGTVLVFLAAGALATGFTFLSREERNPPWNELPASPAADVSVTPIPLSPPSDEVLTALLAGPSNEVLFADAASALERGWLEESRRTLLTLLKRDPEYPGAQALLERVETERRKAAERRRPAKAEPAPVAVAKDPTDAELFSEAETAFARGELSVSKRKLEALLKVNPGFAGASQLMEKIEHRIWTMTLPRSFAARHNHRIGGCEGELSLTRTGLTFRSDDHDWSWQYDSLVSLDRPDAVNLNIVTSERDLMGLLSKKRYRFRLEAAFSDDDWRFFQKNVLGAEAAAR